MIILTKSHFPPNPDYKEGAVVLIDKPKGWTSFDIVNKMRYAIRKHYEQKKFKVGHNGTLDPLATGLLMIFIGKYTKRIPQEENHDKRYTGTIKLGATTPSLDLETEEKDFLPVDHIDLSGIKLAMKSFLGESEQEIPIYSATKHKGMAMYKYAREGKVLEPKYKTVNFIDIECLSYEKPFIKFDLKCGKGTYVRAFARDLGKKLNTSAYLYDLRRTKISDYSVNDAIDVNTFCQSFVQ